jgi:predicted DNA binding protein
MKIKVFVSQSSYSLARLKASDSKFRQLADDRFTSSQIKKLMTKGTKLLMVVTGAYTRKADNKVTPQLNKYTLVIKEVEIAGNGKLKRVLIAPEGKHSKDEIKPLSAAALAKLLNGEKATLKSKKGTKSASLK